MIVSCRYSIVQHSPTKLAGGAAVPVSLASGGAGCLAVLQDLPRVAEAGLYTLETVWRLAEDATVGPEGDYGCRGPGAGRDSRRRGRTRATQRTTSAGMWSHTRGRTCRSTTR